MRARGIIMHNNNNIIVMWYYAHMKYNKHQQQATTHNDQQDARGSGDDLNKKPVRRNRNTSPTPTYALLLLFLTIFSGGGYIFSKRDFFQNQCRFGWISIATHLNIKALLCQLTNKPTSGWYNNNNVIIIKAITQKQNGDFLKFWQR